MSFLGIPQTPTFAFALFQLTTSYTGPLINVTRSSDGATSDIGIVNGLLDTATLLSFVGGGNGFVNTWYDQSGNGNNASAISANSVKIVTSGSLTLLYNLPAIYNLGNGLEVPVSFASNPFTVMCLVNNEQAPSQTLIYSNFTTTGGFALGWTTANDLDLQFEGTSYAASSYISPSEDHLISFVSPSGYVAGNVTLEPYIDTTQTATAVSLNFSNETLVNTTIIGGFSGNLNAMIAWPEALDDTYRGTAETTLATLIGQNSGNAYNTQSTGEILFSQNPDSVAAQVNLQGIVTENSNAVVAKVNLQALVPVNLGPYVTTRDMANTIVANSLSLVAFSANDHITNIAAPSFDSSWTEDGSYTDSVSSRVVTAAHQMITEDNYPSVVTATFPHAILSDVILMNIIIGPAII